MRIFNCLLSFFIVIVMSACQQPEKQPLSMVAIFADHLVLQSEQPVAIWGKYTPGERVTVSGSWGESVTGLVDDEGNWKMDLSTSPAGGPYELEIATTDSTILLNDVMLGEVWLASGQSNMEMPLPGFLPKEPIANAENEIANASYPNIRMFTVKRNLRSKPQNDLVGNWQVCTPENAVDFSATGYFFARKLHQELQVPVGIIHSSWGGTVAEAWSSKSGLSEFPQFIKTIDAHDNSVADRWMAEFDKVPMPENLEQLALLDLGDDQILKADYDDGSWQKMSLPAGEARSENFISGEVASQRLNGVFWYRKNIEIQNRDTDYVLTIGAIDDADIVYFNGRKIGATWSWQAKRSYIVKKAMLKDGLNTIAIKHYDGGGGSNISGPMLLETEKGIRIDLAGEWSGLYYADLAGDSLLVYGLAEQAKLTQRPLLALSDPNGLPSSLYNAMIHPLVPYSLAGAIWYQGESNVGRDKEYESLFPALITDWRNQWKEEFPFYYVQIAPYQYGGQVSPALRDAQRKTLRVPATGMAVTLDIGDSLSIHPGNKQTVGDRLSRLALSHYYKKELIPSGPIYKKFTVNGNKMILDFEYAEGLKLINGTGFEIAGADKKYVPARAKIVNNRLEVTAPQISNPQFIRYGWRDYFSATLFNGEGLPASSFSTE